MDLLKATLIEGSETKEEAEDLNDFFSILEEIQKKCPHSHDFKDLDPEDGCIHCGFYSK